MKKYKLIEWFLKLLSGEPHFVIGRSEGPYMLRWYLLPRNPWFNVYLHKFLRDDDDRALHDHPWNFVSLMIKGSYIERRPNPYRDWPEFDPEFIDSKRGSPSIAFRRATDKHRVTLARNPDGSAKPCWTIVVTGSKIREWGFWCPKGFVHWQDFCASDNKGNVGKGCGD